MSLYYESHITVEPVFEEKLDQFKAICQEYGFRVADLLMQKRKDSSEERSKNDSFCTGRDSVYDDILKRMLGLVVRLQDNGFSVWRYKIEQVVLDSRYDDSLHKLNKKKTSQVEKACDHHWVLDGHNAGDPICSKCFAR